MRVYLQTQIARLSQTLLSLRNERRSPLRVSVSIERRLNLGNYESASVMLSLSGIEPGTTGEQLQAALATGALGYKAIKGELAKKIQDQRLQRAV